MDLTIAFLGEELNRGLWSRSLDLEFLFYIWLGMLTPMESLVDFGAGVRPVQTWESVARNECLGPLGPIPSVTVPEWSKIDVAASKMRVVLIAAALQNLGTGRHFSLAPVFFSNVVK